MAVLRLEPRFVPTTRAFSLGRCAACSERIARGGEVVHMYGETFHRDCAFYRSRQRTGDAR